MYQLFKCTNIDNNNNNKDDFIRGTLNNQRQHQQICSYIQTTLNTPLTLVDSDSSNTSMDELEVA
jgi:hypothetical protein